MTACSGFSKYITLLFMLLLLAVPAFALEKTDRSPRSILESIAKTWEDIQDFQCVFQQIEQQPNGETKRFWVHAKVVQEHESGGQRNGTLRLDFYEDDIPVSALAGPAVPATPVVTYYASPQKILYTYKPKANTLTREWLDDSGPLPEFLKLAGLAQFDMDELQDKVFVNKDVYEEVVDEVSCYRLHFFPKPEHKSMEPDRLLWVNRENYLPKRFEVAGDWKLSIQFKDMILNQGLRPQELMPNIPRNVKDYDLRKNKTRGE
ncbi:MAG: hypothetical protein P9L94_08180 [Candidatus Hinthialibacter antarcticus]|nr:hypothetical protein [Candidatus Hinthialibacter antarcticus]